MLVSHLDRFRLGGQVALVTGAGRGIGAACARALAEAGADVVICARTQEQLDATASAVESAGRAAHIVVADLNDLARAPDVANGGRRAIRPLGHRGQ